MSAIDDDDFDEFYRIGSEEEPPEWFYDAVEEGSIIPLSLDGELPMQAAKVQIGEGFMHVAYGQLIGFAGGCYTIRQGKYLL